MFHHYCLHQNHLAEWLNTKKIWLRKNIKLCMKNEIMASEWRSLQICWLGNHFKANCSKCGLDLLLEKHGFSIYVTYSLFLHLHSVIQAERTEREVTSHNKHVSSGKEMNPSVHFENDCHFMLDYYIHTVKHMQNQKWKTKAAFLSHENMVRQNKRSLK